MFVRELIEVLSKLDPELTVTFSDSEDGTQVVSDVDIIEDSYVGGWDKATVLHLSGDYPEKKFFDEKYYHIGEPRVYKPSPLWENFKVVYEESLKNSIILLSELPKPMPDKDRFVEFKIIKERNENPEL